MVTVRVTVRVGVLAIVSKGSGQGGDVMLGDFYHQSYWCQLSLRCRISLKASAEPIISTPRKCWIPEGSGFVTTLEVHDGGDGSHLQAHAIVPTCMFSTSNVTSIHPCSSNPYLLLLVCS
jgi:hypothetical protein